MSTIYSNYYIDNQTIPEYEENDFEYRHDNICEFHSDCSETSFDEIDMNKYTIIDYIYVDPTNINSWEHDEIHHVDNIIEYIKDIMPVLAIKRGDEYRLVYDGNHRVNTCKEWGVKVPAYLISHYHNKHRKII